MKRTQLFILLPAVALLSACTVVPGTNLSTTDKTVGVFQDSCRAKLF